MIFFTHTMLAKIYKRCVQMEQVSWCVRYTMIASAERNK